MEATATRHANGGDPPGRPGTGRQGVPTHSSVPSAKAVALISRGEWPAFRLGPPVIGGLAELVGLRAALGVIVVGALLIVLFAGFVRDRAVTPAGS